MALNLGFEYVRQFDNCTKKETLDWINLGKKKRFDYFLIIKR